MFKEEFNSSAQKRCNCQVRVVDSISVAEYNRCYDGAASLNLYTDDSSKRLSSPLNSAASAKSWGNCPLTTPSTKNISKIPSLPANVKQCQPEQRTAGLLYVY